MSDANKFADHAITPLELRAFIVALLSVILGTAATYLSSEHPDPSHPDIALFGLVTGVPALGLTLYWFRLRKRLRAEPRAQQINSASFPKKPILISIGGRLLSVAALLALGAFAGIFPWAEWIAVAGGAAYAAWRTWEMLPNAKIGIASAPHSFVALLGGCAIVELVGIFLGAAFSHK